MGLQAPQCFHPQPPTSANPSQVAQSDAYLSLQVGQGPSNPSIQEDMDVDVLIKSRTATHPPLIQHDPHSDQDDEQEGIEVEGLILLMQRRLLS